MLSTIFKAYKIDAPESITLLTSGLINKTWKVVSDEKHFIVQQINHHVFKKPFDLADNIKMIGSYLKKHAPDYLLVSALNNVHDETIFFDGKQDYFRIFPFIKGSHTIDVVSTPDQAFEAAFQFGKFTRLLSGFDAAKLHVTIPDFHNLSLRYQQFQDALQNGNSTRIKQSQELIDTIKKHTTILSEFERIQKSRSIKKRVTHHDTKISNVLFNDQGKGICIIDLDTTMAGYFISDVGDMMRTYLSPANEEEKDFGKIEIRDNVFEAIVHGYVSTMGDELSNEEQKLILYSGLFLTYMQALRFLTDYFNDDVYYGANYEGHNLIRAGNQLQLLKKLLEKKDIFQTIISNELKRKRYFL